MDRWSASAEGLIREIYPPLAGEIRSAVDLANRHSEGPLTSGIVSGGSSSMEDCAFLYLLIRHFGRRHAFEVGTYIGTTAVAMNEAARANGGWMTTSDVVDYGFIPPWSGIRFMHMPASIALATLSAERHPVDFAFFDWVPDESTIAQIDKIFTDDAILAVHDCHPSDPKGDAIVRLLQDTYCAKRDGVWLFPAAAPFRMDDGMTINQCTAAFIPSALVELH